jgi:hypothetical protein
VLLARARWLIIFCRFKKKRFILRFAKKKKRVPFRLPQKKKLLYDLNNKLKYWFKKIVDNEGLLG